MLRFHPQPQTEIHTGIICLCLYDGYFAGLILQGIGENSMEKNTKPMGVEFLSESEIKALFEQPDTTTKKGVRDLLLMIMLYDTGARIQELLNLKICDIQFGNASTVKVLGKGSKYRYIPVMPKTMEHIRKYLKLYHSGRSDYTREFLFYTE